MSRVVLNTRLNWFLDVSVLDDMLNIQIDRGQA